jgi:hypothetical protein
MKKVILISGLVVALGAVVAILVGYKFTKSHSPEELVSYEEGDLRIAVSYNRPFKKGRQIFGALVPYGKTWRTGANEPTTLETNKDITIGGKILKKGRYSLWTVPNETSWQVVFNSSVPNWGVDVMKNGQAARDEKTDALVIEVPVMQTEKEFEQFTIRIEKADDALELVLAWDKTLVVVPFVVSE